MVVTMTITEILKDWYTRLIAYFKENGYRESEEREKDGEPYRTYQQTNGATDKQGFHLFAPIEGASAERVNELLYNYLFINNRLPLAGFDSVVTEKPLYLDGGSTLRYYIEAAWVSEDGTAVYAAARTNEGHLTLFRHYYKQTSWFKAGDETGVFIINQLLKERKAK